ncbi:ATP-binding cassette domain-containing protein [Nocardia seriolae]|uniref:ABC transporter ATP-binding protein n=1 Tax=Nocardia seriolae TaxID=37332 RepID=A0A0B8NFZ4_9NOCA|nr:ATP-binding cassette domain-containing protein [Nocardia seriolae]APA95461.1 Putative ABC transporter B family member [Nocardia seriolae]MTJ66394.1 ATP-binding cassette domain-containing protein [Nocardia seriolae]MTJ72032.1 ATP-binding cassette domain-containing protein [Nocardia seriolae]MTJ85702.1 ATP-binding cassette domain-containing protein [Nocardia seriolae]MTK29699.1 ATP-binding cassette domain-containing protein [Nocardia seriolae]
MRTVLADFRRIRELLELSRARMALSIGWGVLALGSGLGLAALAAWLIARAWQMPPVLDLSIAVVTVRALGISRGLCRYLERLATHDVALRAMSTARTTTYRTLAGADIWRPRRTGAATAGPEDEVRQGDPTQLRRGELLGRVMNDIDDLGAVVVRAFVPIAVAIILSLLAVGLLASISVLAAAILAVALAVSGIIAPWLSARAAREAELAVRTDRTEFTAEALTVLDHAPELRVAGRLSDAVGAATAAGQRAVAAEDRAAARSAWAAAVLPLSIGASVLGALLIGIVLYGSGTPIPTAGFQTVPPGGITPMAFTVLVLVLVPLSAFEAVAVLPAAAQALTTGRAALHRLNRLEHDESDSPVPTFPPLPAGRRIAVVGPSGAGKTTLLMAWAGLFDTPHPGVTFFAEDAHLFGTTVLENLRVARGDITAAEAETALRAVGAGPWLDSLPDGVDTDLVGGAAAVSGGQRRRILLARALLSPACTLLLDEPTEHLEADAGAELLRRLLDESSGLVDRDRTVVVVTHQLPSDAKADTIVRVQPGGSVSIETFIAATTP